MNPEQLWWYPLLDFIIGGKPVAASIDTVANLMKLAEARGRDKGISQAHDVMQLSIEKLDLTAEIEAAVNEGRKLAYEEMKNAIESSHMSVCGDPKTAQDITAAIKMFKFQLVRSLDGRIAKLSKVA